MTATGVALASPMGATVKAAQRCKHKHDGIVIMIKVIINHKYHYMPHWNLSQDCTVMMGISLWAGKKWQKHDIRGGERVNSLMLQWRPVQWLVHLQVPELRSKLPWPEQSGRQLERR